MEWRWSAVLGDEVYQRIETVQMYCADILDKKCTSSLVKKLNDVYPLSEMTHLKRVRTNQGKLSILLLPCNSEQDKADLQTSLIQRHALVGIGDVSIVTVANDKPITRKQHEEASSFWPTNFHEDKRLEKMLRGDLFSAGELSNINANMNTCIAKEEAKTCAEPSVCSCVIVDPDVNVVVAKAHADLDHPIRHAVMVCLDRVAAKQGGGAWSNGATCDEVSSLAVEEEPPSKRHKQTSQYLCTGFDAYITKEPCVMCAMALLHSRIRRVFYCHRSPFCGALGSQYKLHIQKGLNHHFEVYEGRSTLSNVTKLQ